MIRRKLELSLRRSVSSLSKELDISETSTFMTALKRKGVYKRTIFQLDGAPTHCSKVAIEWLTEKFGENRLISRNSSFQWPPYSPDLNPVDHLSLG